MIPFAEAITQSRILLFDGAVGTQLAARGGVQSPIANVECPGIVKSIHTDYKAAGASILSANTLTANPISLEHAGLLDKFTELNAEGVRLCREVAGADCWVAGDMTSTGKLMEPLGDYTKEQLFDCFARHAAFLAESGVDLIVIETMTDVAEARVAVEAAKSAAGLPVVASVSFDPGARGFRTMMGDTIERAVSELLEAGADVIGSNCGTLDPNEMSEVIARMRALTGAPLVAQPNAGKPELSAGRVTFMLSPEDFAEGVMKCVEAGATLIGGCCGTTAAHTAALTTRLR